MSFGNYVMNQYYGKKKNQFLQGDLRSGVRSTFLKTGLDLVGVRLILITFLLAETDFDFDRFFYLSLIYIIICRGVRFYFSSLTAVNLLGLRFSDKSGWVKAYSQLILSSYFFFKQPLIKSFDNYEILGSKTIGL